MFLSIIIPAYNEEKRIGETLDDYLGFYTQDVEVIVVLNGCQDRTLDEIKKRKDRFSQILRYIEIKEAIGKGAAVKIGFEAAKGDLIGFVDADNATSPTEFDKIVQTIDGTDACIASRLKKGSQVINRTVMRKIVSLGFVAIVKLLFGMPFADTQCGAKIFKKNVIKEVIPFLTTTNMAFDVELLYIILKKGYKIKELPSVWIEKSSSALLGSPFKLVVNGVKVFFTLLHIRFKKYNI